MKQWEYLTAYINVGGNDNYVDVPYRNDKNKMVSKLISYNELGAQGWELAVSYKEGTRFVFKREKIYSPTHEVIPQQSQQPIQKKKEEPSVDLDFF